MQKRRNKTKDEIKKEMVDSQEARRQMDKIKNELFPYLFKNSESIGDAKMLIQMASMGIKQSFLILQKQMSVSDLKLSDHLRDTESAKKIAGFIELLSLEKVDEADRLLEDVMNIIYKHERDADNVRKLEDLNIDLL